MDAHQSLEESTCQIAGAIGEPSRARMLFALLDDRARTSTELALVADVSPSTASVHLARLHGARLVELHVQGRHRYYRLASRRVARMLEQLSVLAGARGTRARAPGPRQSSTPAHLVGARTCYDHLAGALGVALHDALIERGWLVPSAGASGAYSPTEAGHRQLGALAIDVDQLRTARRRLAFGCLDWSERRPHLAGALGAALLSMMLQKRWLRRELHSRAVSVTAIGVRELGTRLGLRVDA